MSERNTKQIWSVGDRSIVALGAIVTSSIPADCVAYGNPAKWKPIELPKPDGAEISSN